MNLRMNNLKTIDKQVQIFIQYQNHFRLYRFHTI